MSNLCTRVVPSPAPAAMAGPTSPPVPKSQNTVAMTVSAADSVFSSHAVNTTISASPQTKKITTMRDLLKDYVGNTQETDKTQKARQIVERLAQDKTIKTSNLSNESVTRFIDLIHTGMVHNTETETPCRTRITNAIGVLQKLVDNDKQALSYANCCEIASVVCNYYKDCKSNDAFSNLTCLEGLINTLVSKKHIFSNCHEALNFIHNNFDSYPGNRCREQLRLLVYTRPDMPVTTDEELPKISTDIAAEILAKMSNENEGKGKAVNIILGNNNMSFIESVQFVSNANCINYEVFYAIVNKSLKGSRPNDRAFEMYSTIQNEEVRTGCGRWIINCLGRESSSSELGVTKSQVTTLIDIMQKEVRATQNPENPQWSPSSICMLRRLINNDELPLSAENCHKIVDLILPDPNSHCLLTDLVSAKHIFSCQDALGFVRSHRETTNRDLLVCQICKREDMRVPLAETALSNVSNTYPDKMQAFNSVLKNNEMTLRQAVDFAGKSFSKCVCDEVFDAILKKFPGSGCVNDRVFEMYSAIQNEEVRTGCGRWIVKHFGDKNSSMESRLENTQVKLLLKVIQEIQNYALQILDNRSQNCHSVCVLLQRLINNDNQPLSEPDFCIIIETIGCVNDYLPENRAQLIISMGSKQHVFPEYQESLDFIHNVPNQTIQNLYILGVCQRRDLSVDNAQTLLASIPDMTQAKQQTVNNIVKREEMSFVNAVDFAFSVFKEGNCLDNALSDIVKQYSTRVVAEDVDQVLRILKASHVSLEVLGPLAVALIGNKDVSLGNCEEIFRKVIVSQECCQALRNIITAFVAREDISLQKIKKMEDEVKDYSTKLCIVEELLNQYGTLGQTGASGSDAKTKPPVVIKVTKGNDSIYIKKSDFLNSADADRILLQWVKNRQDISLTQVLPLLKECAKGVSIIALGDAAIACIRRGNPNQIDDLLQTFCENFSGSNVLINYVSRVISYKK